MSIYACPVCSKDLVVKSDERRFVCDDGHSFDIAKEGYVNLLLANQKKSSDPGDSKAMVWARRDFFVSGHYAALSDALNQQVADIAQQQDGIFTLLDVGCGEGYYLRRLREYLAEQPVDLHGTDISKDAVRYAAKADKDSTYSVASLYSLPVRDDSVHCLMRVFAPRAYREFSRILRDNGILIAVVPAANHLQEIRAIVYDTPQPHTPEDPADRDSSFSEISQQRVQYTTTLTSTDAIHNLLQMTPYYWHLSDDARATFEELASLTITVDCMLHVYQKRPEHSDR